jgi:hypothetical protein
MCGTGLEVIADSFGEALSQSDFDSKKSPVGFVARLAAEAVIMSSKEAVCQIAHTYLFT